MLDETGDDEVEGSMEGVVGRFACADGEIFGSVVIAPPIQVMHNLAFAELATELLFHDQMMLELPASFPWQYLDADIPVPISIGCAKRHSLPLRLPSQALPLGNAPTMLRGWRLSR